MLRHLVKQKYVEDVNTNKADLNVNKIRRTVVEVCDYLHREIRRLALLNDLRIYELTNGIIEDFLKDQEQVKAMRMQKLSLKL